MGSPLISEKGLSMYDNRTDRWWRGALAAAALLAGVLVAPAGAAAAEPAPAPLRAATGPTVPGSYVVVLKSAAAVSRATARGVAVAHRYRHALNGFSAKLTPDQLTALRADPDVAYVTPNHRFTLDVAQTPATWGLDRVDQRDRGLDNVYDHNRTGAGVTVYVIDSGIRATHVEFGGRVAGGASMIGGNATDDCIGHGTHVAGTVGSAAWGVAKNVRLVPVRIFGCSPYTSTDSVLAGVDWVTANATAPAVANMSLGGPADAAIDEAVQNSINAGITYVVSSGNSNADACGFSPARVPAAVTVGATDTNDVRGWFSNFGGCVDLHAPGVDIVSASSANDTDPRTNTGTSMASPHVSGAAALYLQTHPAAPPAEVAAWLTGNATPGVVTDPAGAPNLLLFANGPGTHTAMTWAVKEQRADNVVLVGSDGQTNAYQGDTAAGASLPVLCLRETGAAVPAGLTLNQYNGWAFGEIQLTPPVPGSELTSFTAASRICAAHFGGGWRMAEFHDGRYPFQLLPRPGLPVIWRASGWNLWAHGTLPATTRFWASINDQPANPWS
ncbi:S8 family peptidase [Actinomycetes bacterium KLBMP 9797]